MNQSILTHYMNEHEHNIGVNTAKIGFQADESVELAQKKIEKKIRKPGNGISIITDADKGILLHDKWHRRIDRLEWVFYDKEGTQIQREGTEIALYSNRNGKFVVHVATDSSHEYWSISDIITSMSDLRFIHVFCEAEDVSYLFHFDAEKGIYPFDMMGSSYEFDDYARFCGLFGIDCNRSWLSNLHIALLK